MPVPSDAVASSPITAVQRDIGVWVRRAASAVAWSRSHLLCHWLEDHLPSKRRLLEPCEPKTWRDHGAITDDPGAVTGIGEEALPPYVKVRLSRRASRPAGGSDRAKCRTLPAGLAPFVPTVITNRGLCAWHLSTVVGMASVDPNGAAVRTSG